MKLDQEAKKASSRAYSPYSNFPVGAVVETENGKTFAGCNVENVSFGLTNCAERTAIFAMIAAGEKNPTQVTIYTPTKATTLPCGACRQVLYEFNPKMKVRCICDGQDLYETTLDQLLPAAFPKDSLKK
jgi:cytidine deaminase